MKRLIVGVDVSKTHVDVAYWNETEPLYLGQFENQTHGHRQLKQRIDTLAKKHNASFVFFVLEPTGGYEQTLTRFAIGENFTVALPNPKAVRHWAKANGIRTKTDKQDALVLAHYGAKVELKPWQPPDESVEILEGLLNRLIDLEKMQRMETNRIDALSCKPVTPKATLSSLQESIEFLQKQIHQIQATILTHFDQNPPLAKVKENLQSVPGVGNKNAKFLVAFLLRFDSLTHGTGTAKQLTALAGLDPVVYQSGSSVEKKMGISKEGDCTTRRYLYLGALGGRRGDNPLAEFYQRLIDRGKPAMVALIACARKILVWSWAIFKAETVFNPQLARPNG